MRSESADGIKLEYLEYLMINAIAENTVKSSPRRQVNSLMTELSKRLKRSSLKYDRGNVEHRKHYTTRKRINKGVCVCVCIYIFLMGSSML